MKYLESYLNKIIASGNPQLAESIQKSSDEIGDTRLRKFSYVGHEIGLLFGNVQSGKTGQVFGIISKAADMGFPAFVLLTTDNIALYQQTLDRFVGPTQVLVSGDTLQLKDYSKTDWPWSMFDPEKSKSEVRGDKLKYVSRGGLKLEKALATFPINLTDAGFPFH